VTDFDTHAIRRNAQDGTMDLPRAVHHVIALAGEVDRQATEISRLKADLIGERTAHVQFRDRMTIEGEEADAEITRLREWGEDAARHALINRRECERRDERIDRLRREIARLRPDTRGENTDA
jgi:hypothetical protein